MSFIFSTTHVTNRNVLASSSHYAIYSTTAVTMESSMISVLSNTKVYSYKYYSAIGTTTSMTSRPVSTSQSTVSNTLVGAISTVFILLVVTILVILIVSVLVCRRSHFGTSYTNSDSEKVHEQQQGN